MRTDRVRFYVSMLLSIAGIVVAVWLASIRGILPIDWFVIGAFLLGFFIGRTTREIEQ